MKWHREVDYHGSRSYDRDGSQARPFSAIKGWIAGLSGRKAAKKRGTAASLSASGHEGYSLLGATRPAPAQRPADCPFPLKPGSFDGRDWRLLP